MLPGIRAVGAFFDVVFICQHNWSKKKKSASERGCYGTITTLMSNHPKHTNSTLPWVKYPAEWNLINL